MAKPELVLSNATTFFSGNIENLFKLAKKHGFRYLEIIPYRWTTAAQLANLSEKYGLQIAGIHLPVWWNKPQKKKLFTPLFHLYIGSVQTNPGLQIAKTIKPDPYLLIHENVKAELGTQKFAELSRAYHVVVENIPENPLLMPGGVFDHGHFNQSRLKNPSLNLFESYRQAQPEILHISYNSRFIHLLPNDEEQKELKRLLEIHLPRYIVLETNPWVSVRKGKRLLSTILESLY